MSAPNLLDLSRLDAALGGDRGLMTEILQMYESTAAMDVEELSQAVEDGNVDTVVRRAHAIKGASGNVGADAVMDVAGRIERAGRDGELEQALALVPDLRAAFAETLAASQAYRAA
ncbi:MAG: Hpt domain-containing protein [Myxococcota bacterium]